MLDERAHLSSWEPLKAVLRHSREVPGSWQQAVAALRERYGVPPFARAQAQRAPSRAAVRERLKRYRKKEVEPRVWAEAEEEVARERAKPANALYNLLHPGAGPVAHVLEGHEWGPATLQDYRRWARMRVLLDKWPQRCPVCGAEGATAEPEPMPEVVNPPDYDWNKNKGGFSRSRRHIFEGVMSLNKPASDKAERKKKSRLIY